MIESYRSIPEPLLPDNMPILTAEHLKKDFPLRSLRLFGPPRAVHAVDDGNIALYPGRALAVVGESGSGKTTIARMLARLYDPTSGVIKFRGESVRITGGVTNLRAY